MLVAKFNFALVPISYDCAPGKNTFNTGSKDKWGMIQSKIEYGKVTYNKF